jgi:hypothetical protein
MALRIATICSTQEARGMGLEGIARLVDEELAKYCRLCGDALDASGLCRYCEASDEGLAIRIAEG